MAGFGGTVDDFSKAFMSTPTAYSSIVITNPDLPPPASASTREEENEGLLDNSSYKVDHLHVSQFPAGQ